MAKIGLIGAGPRVAAAAMGEPLEAIESGLPHVSPLPRTSPMSVSRFFSFDGVDGVGKSTQIQLCIDWLRAAGHEVVACRDPGTTPLGEQLRQIVLQGHEMRISPECETLIYMAARAQLVSEVIRPALEQGQIVMADRYLLANVVYQGYGFALDVDQLWAVGQFATGGLLPAMTIVLDLDVDAAAARRQGTADRMESRDRAYFDALRQGFLTEARRHPQSMAVVDAGRGVEEIQAEIRALLSPYL